MPPGDDRYDQILALKGRDALPGVAVFDGYYRPRHQWRGPCIVTNNRLLHTVKNGARKALKKFSDVMAGGTK